MVATSPGARPREVARGYVAALSPDGRTVAVAHWVHRAENELLLVHVATGATTIVAHYVDGPVVWSPAGSRVMFTRIGSSNDGLVVCTTATARCRTVVRGPYINGYAFSPDGRSITYGALSVGSGGGVFLLTRNVPSLLTSRYDTVYLWTTAGLIISAVPDGQPQTIALRHRDGSTQTLFTGKPGTPFLRPLAISPDGAKILYESIVSCPPPDPSYTPLACLETGVRLETGPVTGGPLQPASTPIAEASSAAFAPDGSIIAALSTSGSDRYLHGPVFLAVQPPVTSAGPPPPPHLLTRITGTLAIAQ